MSRDDASQAKVERARPEQMTSDHAASGQQPTPAQTNSDQVTSGQVTVVNKRGLHARAAAKFVKLASSFAANVRVSATNCVGAGGTYVSGRSIMGLMMLGAGPGSQLCIETEGTDAPAALAALTALVKGGFDEET